MSETSSNQDKKIVKTEDEKTKLQKALKVFTESPEVSCEDEMKECLGLMKKEKLSPKERKRRSELQLQIAMAHALENGFWAYNLSHGKYREGLTNMRVSLIKNYDCKTATELMLADRIVASYWRTMQCEKIFNRLVEKEEGGYSFDQLKVNIIKELNKSIDLANRQLNTNIILLKELKQPKLNVRVNTKSAFISENQQFNVTKQNEQHNEIIEPK